MTDTVGNDAVSAPSQEGDKLRVTLKEQTAAPVWSSRAPGSGCSAERPAQEGCAGSDSISQAQTRSSIWTLAECEQQCQTQAPDKYFVVHRSRDSPSEP